MATLSADNTTVTTDQDFTNLATQYGAVSFVNTPAQAAPAATYGACLPESTSVEASGVLVGTLVGEVCGLLPSVGGNCDDIAANGTTGVQGDGNLRSGNLPLLRLLPILRAHRAATSCDFAGNATVNPTVGNIAATSNAVSSCLPSPTAVFTPSAVATASGSAGSGSSGSSGSGSGSNRSEGNAAMALGVGRAQVLGVLVVVGCVLGGMLWTLG
ncbi:hypothetical protein K438DRAFT_1992178 [Mycena galopus ATCC 62051]|nr:hypothetical protein K438DRAFT_1992178 [Mycena galopus ATCC 62051]